MYEKVEKPKENKSKAVANPVAQNKSVMLGVGLVDNRNISQGTFQLKMLSEREKNNLREERNNVTSFGNNNKSSSTIQELYNTPRQQVRAKKNDIQTKGVKNICQRYERTKSEDKHFSKSNGAKFENLIDDDDRFPVGFKVDNIDEPDLKISKDGSVAIHDCKAARNFYASKAVLDESNEKLKNVRSEVKLVQGPDSITYHSDKLYTTSWESTKEKTKDLKLTGKECNIAASNVAGVINECKANPVINNETKKGGGFKDIASETADNVEGKGEQTITSSDDYKNRIEMLGVNDFAQADVGEVLGTITTTKIYSKGFEIANVIDEVTDEKKNSKNWSWHFAATVARSLNGKDMITLENYNRDSEYTEKIKNLYEHLREECHEFKAILSERKEGEKRENHYNRYLALEKLSKIKGSLKNAGEEIQKSAIRVENLKQETEWFFAMYGPAITEDKGENQSFHKAMKDTGDFTNPITIKFRSDNLIEFNKARGLEDGRNQNDKELPGTTEYNEGYEKGNKQFQSELKSHTASPILQKLIEKVRVNNEWGKIRDVCGKPNGKIGLLRAGLDMKDLDKMDPDFKITFEEEYKLYDPSKLRLFRTSHNVFVRKRLGVADNAEEGKKNK